MKEVKDFAVSPEEANTRVDVYLVKQMPELSRSYIQKLIEEERVTVNGRCVKPNYKVRDRDEIQVIIPPPENLEVKAEDIPLDILYEDQDVIVINKPRGMVVHPACGNYSGTLVNALLKHCDDLSGINGVIRPGIVHRIDKDTSGVLVVAKNDQAHLDLAAQIKAHSVKRQYVALVHGNLADDRGKIDAPIGRNPVERQKMAVTTKNSRKAITHWRVLERFGDYTLVKLTLETGRTHQIRVHMAFIGHPVVGDPKYGPRKRCFAIEGQALHAQTLGFVHPRTGRYMEFAAPVPPEMQGIIEYLRQRGK